MSVRKAKVLRDVYVKMQRVQRGKVSCSIETALRKGRIVVRKHRGFCVST